VNRFALCVFASTLALLATAPAIAQQDPVAEPLQGRIDELQSSGPQEIGGTKTAARKALPAVYANRDFRPMWTNESRIQELQALIQTAPQHGLATSDYYLDQLQSQIAASGSWPEVPAGTTLKQVCDFRETRRLNTPRLPVLILYLTASLEPDGRSRFLKDVYGRDAPLFAALNDEVIITLPSTE
jgi:murein L,D-transpeptidase YcbB/YkuD